ncbi:MAG: GTP-binding protein, partial [bacterium]|nr:GTP-binding protein [bacterium]
YLTYPDLADHQKIVLIIDAKVGVTDLDKQMLFLLEELEKDFIVVANKVDKLKKNDLKKQLEAISDMVHPHPVIPYSTIEKIGIGALTQQIVQ